MLEAKYAAAGGKNRVKLTPTIAQWGNARAEKFLAAIAADGSAALPERQEAIYGLGQTVYTGAEALLDGIARAPAEGDLRRHALWALHRMAAPERAKTFLAVMRGATDRQLLGDAVACLVYVDTPAAHKAVRKAFRQQKDAGLRRQIYHSATRADQAGLPGELVQAALADEDDMIHGDALRDLWDLDARKARAHAAKVFASPTKGRKQHLVWWACRVVGYEGDKKAVEQILEAANQGSSETWSLVLGLLKPNRDPGGVRAIALGLKHRKKRVRSLCASALRSIPAGPVSSAIVQALRKEKSTDIITRLVRALAAQTDPKAVAELLRVAALRDFPARSAAVSALTRVGFENAKVKAFFTKLVESPHWDDRIYAMDAIARAGAVDLAPRVIDNLGHKRWEVRLAAAQCLGRVRVGEAIPALIALLEREEQRRIRVAAADTLFRLTGQEFFDDADGWRRWWETARKGFTVSANVPRRKVRPGQTVATFYGVPVYSERVCFVLDRSGSMDTIDPLAEGKMRMERAVEELLGAAGRFRKGAKINVISFAADVKSWKDSLAPVNVNALEKHLRALTPDGTTNLWDALERAFQDKTVDTIYLLTDGAPNKGKFQRDFSILRELRQLNQTRRVAIHCVSVGTDSDLLREIANEHSGTYTRR